jgi:hypothetical protein
MITSSLSPLSGIQNAKMGFRQLDLRQEAGDLQRASAEAVWLPWARGGGRSRVQQDGGLRGCLRPAATRARRRPPGRTRSPARQRVGGQARRRATDPTWLRARVSRARSGHRGACPHRARERRAHHGPRTRTRPRVRWLHAAVHRPLTTRHPPLVLDGTLRQPQQNGALSPEAAYLSHAHDGSTWPATRRVTPRTRPPAEQADR